MVLRRGEQSGNSFLASEANDFKEVMDRLDMIDLLLLGGQWTWSNNKSLSRIDRFFISAFFFGSTCWSTPKNAASPHIRPFSNCLETEGIQWGPIPFRLDSRWLKEEKSRALAEEKWRRSVIQAIPATDSHTN